MTQNTSLPQSSNYHYKKNADRHFVTALSRGLEILSCFRSANKLLGNQELTQRTQLPKSTVSRLTYTLVKLGYLVQDKSSGKYRLGMATLSLGVGLLAQLDIREVAKPFMQELADYAQAMVTLGVRDRLSMLYVENCRSKSALTLSLDVGARIPIATTSMGRAYLALAPQDERDEIIRLLADELQDPALLTSIKQGIDKAITDYKTLGCTQSFGDWHKEVNAIAAAFQPTPEHPIMVITCGAPSYTVSEQFLMDEVRPKMLEIIQKIKGQG